VAASLVQTQEDQTRKTEIERVASDRLLPRATIHAHPDHRKPNVARARLELATDFGRSRRLRTVAQPGANLAQLLGAAIAEATGTAPLQRRHRLAAMARAVMAAGPMDVEATVLVRVRNSTCGSPSCARRMVDTHAPAMEATAVAAPLPVTAPRAVDTVVHVQAPPAEVDILMAEVVVVTRAVAEVDIPAVAEVTAVVAIAKQVYDWQVDVKTKVK
jgi:hypothetical protein